MFSDKGSNPGYSRARRSGVSRTQSVVSGVTWASAFAGVFHRDGSDGPFEIEGGGFGLSAALPRWLRGRRPEAGCAGSEHAGIRAS